MNVNTDRATEMQGVLFFVKIDSGHRVRYSMSGSVAYEVDECILRYRVPGFPGYVTDPVNIVLLDDDILKIYTPLQQFTVHSNELDGNIENPDMIYAYVDRIPRMSVYVDNRGWLCMSARDLLWNGEYDYGTYIGHARDGECIIIHGTDDDIRLNTQTYIGCLKEIAPQFEFDKLDLLHSQTIDAEPSAR